MSNSDTQSLVAQTSIDYGIDPALGLAVAQQESGFDQGAVSPAGAIGVMQLMPATAAGLGVDPTDEAQNIQGGMSYLRSQLSAFGDPAQALAAYNWGPGNVQKAVAQYGADWLSHAPTETQNYVNSVLNAAGSAASSVAPASGSSSLAADLETSGSSVSTGLLLAAGAAIAAVFIFT
ncbi:MAG: lytic transglycosylase domain-containing protein [Terriglobia bacterium]